MQHTTMLVLKEWEMELKEHQKYLHPNQIDGENMLKKFDRCLFIIFLCQSHNFIHVMLFLF